MSFAILRHGKIKAPGLGAAIAHNHRTSSVEKINIDATRTSLNVAVMGAGVAERISTKLKALTTKVRKDAVVAVELVLSAGPEFFDAITKDRTELRQDPRFVAWVNKSLAWAKKEFGRNLVDATLHMDESSPHVHVMAVPLTKDGRLCAKEVLARTELTRRQTDYAREMAQFGLERGLSAQDTKRRHIRLTEEPGAGGKASALAAELAATKAALATAQADLAKAQRGFARQQRLNGEFLQLLNKLEAEVKELRTKLAEKETQKADHKAPKEATNRAQEAPKQPDQAEAQARAQKAAQEAFEAEWKGLPKAGRLDLDVGTVVAVCGRFEVLHVGRGRHVMHEVPEGQRVREVDLSKQRQRSSLGR